MSILAQLQELSEETQQHVLMTYDQQFSFEVRCALAEWIEDKSWKNLNQDNPDHENFASNLVEGLIKEIKARANNEKNLFKRFESNKTAQNFRINYSQNPFLLVRIIKNCLNTECEVIVKVKNSVINSNPSIRDPNQVINEQIERLNKQAKESEKEVQLMHQEKEQFIINNQEKRKRQQTLQHLNVSVVKKIILN